VIEPLELLIRQEHAYKAKDKLPGQKKPSPGCAKCNATKYDRVHLGAPPNFNHNHLMNEGSYQNLKGGWQRLWCELLEEAGWPRGVAQAVQVEAIIGFSTYGDRDEGNFSWIIEKSLGDALVSGYGYSKGSKKKGTYEWVQVYEGGWLPDDTFYPTRRYSFGNMQAEHTPGESSVRMMLFPIEPVTVPRMPTAAKRRPSKSAEAQLTL
jgi:hypothetical protein